MDWVASIGSIARCPNLRRVQAWNGLLTLYDRKPHCPSVTLTTPTLSSMRHLTRVVLCNELLVVADMRLLSTLPALASFSAQCIQFESGDPLLLSIHALAVKPSFVHLELITCDLTPFDLDHMPVWPYLPTKREPGKQLPTNQYVFDHAAQRYPSLTSITSPNCSDAAIANIVRLPALEELRLSNCRRKRGAFAVLTSGRGFRTLNEAV